MRKIISLMHVSLDGFVAGPNGEMNWIRVDEEMFEYASDRTSHSDTALYGRVTWQMMDAYWPEAGKKPNASKHDIEHSAWYNNVHKVVISRTMQGQQLNNITIISDHIREQITNLKNQPGKDILLLGSPSSFNALVEHNLIDEYWLFINPIFIGNGIPLFKGPREKVQLKLAYNKTLSSGVVCLH